MGFAHIIHYLGSAVFSTRIRFVRSCTCARVSLHFCSFSCSSSFGLWLWEDDGATDAAGLNRYCLLQLSSSLVVTASQIPQCSDTPFLSSGLVHSRGGCDIRGTFGVHTCICLASRSVIRDGRSRRRCRYRQFAGILEIDSRISVFNLYDPKFLARCSSDPQKPAGGCLHPASRFLFPLLRRVEGHDVVPSGSARVSTNRRHQVSKTGIALAESSRSPFSRIECRIED